jgi:thioredoxin reductase (NADPH)
VRLHTKIVGGHGAQQLEGLDIQDTTTGETQTVPAAALFILIGAQPRTDWLPDSILRDSRGFIFTGADLLPVAQTGDGKTRQPLLLETSLPGVFAAGDVRHGSVKRVASAVGEGGIAIQMVHQYRYLEQVGH